MYIKWLCSPTCLKMGFFSGSFCITYYHQGIIFIFLENVFLESLRPCTVLGEETCPFVQKHSWMPPRGKILTMSILSSLFYVFFTPLQIFFSIMADDNNPKFPYSFKIATGQTLVVSLWKSWVRLVLFIFCRPEDVATVDVHAAKDLLGSGHNYLDVRWDYHHHFDIIRCKNGIQCLIRIYDNNVSKHINIILTGRSRSSTRAT